MSASEPPAASQMAVEGLPVDSPMEDQVQSLAERVWKKFQALDESQRYLIAVSGIPGSGKTTFASSLAYHLNRIFQDDWHQKYPNAPDYRLTRKRSNTNGSNSKRDYSGPAEPEVAYVLPMDGFHLTRAQLSAMPNPDEAHYRRGAAFTFDADAYLKLIQKLRNPIEATTSTIRAPSFDHAVKDPVDNDISIPRAARIVIIEGLYTALSYPPSKTDNPSDDTKPTVSPAWAEACTLMDEIWLITVPIPIATERVAKRNFRAGLSPSLEAALERTVNNDMKNAREILDNLPPQDKVTERIESIEDGGWKAQALEDEQQRKETEAEETEMRRLRLQRLGSIAEMVDAGVGM